MVRSDREIALQFAVNYTRGTYDNKDIVDDGFGKAPRYIEPTMEQILQNAEKYLVFLEGDLG